MDGIPNPKNTNPNPIPNPNRVNTLWKINKKNMLQMGIQTSVTGVANRNAAGWATAALGVCGLLHIFNAAIDGTIASTVLMPS